LKSFAVDLLTFSLVWILLWWCFALFDSQTGRAGIYAAAVAACTILFVAYEQQPYASKSLFSRELPRSEGVLYPVTFSGALLRFMAVVCIVLFKGFFDLRFTGHLELTIKSIQSAMSKGGEFGMLATLIFAVVAGTGYATLTIRKGLRLISGVDSTSRNPSERY